MILDIADNFAFKFLAVIKRGSRARKRETTLNRCRVLRNQNNIFLKIDCKDILKFKTYSIEWLGFPVAKEEPICLANSTDFINGLTSIGT